MFVRASILVLVVVVGLAGRADAGDPALRKPKAQAALEHLGAANKLYNVRSFDEAAKEYKAGALVEAAPIFDYNLGQCFRQLHRYDDAIWHYQRFIDQSPETPEHASIARKFIEQMQAEKQQQAMTAPPVDVGDSSPPKRTETSPPAPVIAPPPMPSPGSRGPDWFGYGLIGGGSVAILVGGGFLWNASDLSDRANQTSNQNDASALHDQADRRQLIGIGFVVGGGVLAAVGVLKLALHHDVQTKVAKWDIGGTNQMVFFRTKF